jgi:hypothetical protein
VCALPVRGPARYFGGEEAVLDRVHDMVGAALTGTGTGTGTDTGTGTGTGATPGAVLLGVAEGVFAADLATRCERADVTDVTDSGVGVVVPAGGTRDFLAPWPVTTLGTPDLCEVLPRLGLHTLGDFAALPASDVLGRFGATGALRHRIARGLEGELPGYRVPGLVVRLARLQHGISLRNHQPGFWGGASAADERAAESLTVIQRRFGPDVVVTAVPAGGRAPVDRARFATWQIDRPPTPPNPPNPPTGAPEPPWPGRLPPPAPARVPDRRARAGVEVVDHVGEPVRVTARGMLSSHPARVSVGGGQWAEVTGWSSPWPQEERWWSRARRRSAHLQVTTAGGNAYLLAVERGRWWLAAVYG